MSRYHYYIESKSRKRIIAKKGCKKDILIKDVVELTENSPKPGSLSKGKEDHVFNILVIAAIAGLSGLFVLSIIGSDIFGLKNKLYTLSSDMVSISGLILTVISFNTIRTKLDKYMRFGHTGNRIFILLIILLITTYAVSPLPHFNLESKSANIISLLCFFISFYNFYNS